MYYTVHVTYNFFFVPKQIDADFEALFSEESRYFSSKWESVAPRLIERIKMDCKAKDSATISIMEEIYHPAPGVEKDLPTYILESTLP